MSKEKKETEETEYNKIEPKESSVEDVEVEEVQEKRKVEPIVSSEVKVRKKSLMERLVGGLSGPDGVKSIREYVTQDIIVPAFKNIIADSVTSAINMMMFGDTGVGRRNHSHRPTGYSTPKVQRTNYQGRYQGYGSAGGGSSYRGVNEPPKPVRPKANTMMPVEDYVIEDRRDAVDVLAKIRQDASIYKVVSIAEYYDLIGVPTEWTHNAYGWYYEDLNMAKIQPVRGGYIIVLPPVVHLD